MPTKVLWTSTPLPLAGPHPRRTTCQSVCSPSSMTFSPLHLRRAPRPPASSLTMRPSPRSTFTGCRRRASCTSSGASHSAVCSTSSSSSSRSHCSCQPSHRGCCRGCSFSAAPTCASKVRRKSPNGSALITPPVRPNHEMRANSSSVPFAPISSSAQRSC